ncbi:MAG: DsbA family protein, partial [Xanthobacteraceae bacterium]
MMPTLRIAIPLVAAVLLSPLAAAQTPSPQTPPTSPAASSFSSGQRTEIEGIVKSYLVAHPEVLQAAMDALDKQQKQADADKAQATIKKDNATLFDSPHQVVLGNPQGSEQVVEFFDYNCAFCKRALPDMLTLLKT